MIQRIQFQTLNSPILSRVMRQGPIEDEYDLDPPYQRGSVWTDEQRRALVMSLLQGLPIGAIFVNRRSVMEPLVVVDGKQRMETVIAFARGEFSVPADWFRQTDGERGQRGYRVPSLDPHFGGGEVVWSDLTDPVRRFCENDWLVAFYETRLPTEADERELYERINYSGTPHEPLS